jgi:MtN3 and saliva related transmembrane protein
MNLNLLGYIAGSLVVLSLLPQVVKSWKTKSTKDISLARYVVYIVGLMLWILYAILIHNGPVAVMNAIGLVLASVILYLKLRHG